MKKWLIAYFDLTKREFNGLLVLACLILLFAAVPYAYRFWLGKQEHEEAGMEAAVRLLEKTEVQEARRNSKTQPSADKKRPASLFFFDPNTLGSAGWQSLGLSQRQAAAILKYISKGGKFRKPEDLQKMYTISSFMYKRLIPYIRINQDVLAKTQPGTKIAPHPLLPEKRELKVIEINGADSAALCEVRGIGPVFAQRILKYRERIGGFHQKTQLLEVFGIDSVKYAGISGQLCIDLSLLKKISINTAVREDFKNHPYIRYKQVNALIEYRKQHGNYSNIADLNKVLILDPLTIARMAPYFSF